MTTTLATVGTFSSFCLAANSGEGAGQKMITGVPENSNNSENKKIVNAKPSNEKIDEKQLEERLKEDLPKIIEQIKKIEESESKSNGSGSSSGSKCVKVDEKQIKKAFAKSRDQVSIC